MNILRFDSLGSTNSFLKERSKKERLENFTVVVAKEQSAGRGQGNNKWISVKGKNLTFSLFFRPAIEEGDEFLIQQIFSLGIKEALDRYTQGISIKWPNDIYFGDRKMGGILVENEYIGNRIASSVVGIGLNVNQEEFPEGAARPVSLIQVRKQATDLDSLLKEILDKIEEYEDLRKKGEYASIRNRYLSCLYRKEGYHPFYDKNGFFEARILRVEKDGRLVLERKDKGFERYSYKEVMWVIEG